MTFSKIKLFGFLALSYSLIACGQTPVSTASNATPNAIAQTTTVPQPTESPVSVAKSPEPQSSVTQVAEKSPEPKPSAVASTKVETAIAQSQDASAKTTVAQQTTDVDAETVYRTFESVSKPNCFTRSITEQKITYSVCSTLRGAASGRPGITNFFYASKTSAIPEVGEAGYGYFYYLGGTLAAIEVFHDNQLFMFDDNGKLQAELIRRDRTIRTTFSKEERDRLEKLAKERGADILSKFESALDKSPIR